MKKKSLLFFLLLVGVAMACVKHDLVTPTIQLKKDAAEISSYISDNQVLATETPEGVWYWIDTPGLGQYPVLSDSVKILSYASQIPAESTQAIGPRIDSVRVPKNALLSSVISGLQIGLLRFPVGSKGRLYIPSGLAFGVTGVRSIPSNANLYYEVELTSAVGTRLTTDTTAVSSYVGTITTTLVTEGITHIVKDPSGIRYSYDSIVKAGARPTLTSKVNVDLTAQILNATSSFYSVSDTTIDLTNTPVTAFKIILPKITVGTTITIYVPSGYAYGALSPSTAIPANSNLIYTITLKSVF
jgi:FKBP-type peptidyl-prolyl cis-trans isomerase